ncbi:MAG TPA: spore coat U domain-containing protein [Nevskiaceae bacterium]|nr:spore coat U domain-containing protein [Nevskiaceae bacterium]
MKRRAALALLLLAGLPGRAWAVANCSTSATSVAFGNYNPFSASATTSTGTVTVSCSLLGLISLGVNYKIKLSAGTGSSGYNPRQMANGVNKLNYNLYLDTNNGTGTIWTSTAPNIVEDGYFLGLGTVTRHYTVYGRIPALQNARRGTYLDTITVTVDY